MNTKESKELYKRLEEASHKVYLAANDVIKGRNIKIREAGKQALYFQEITIKSMMQADREIYECYKQVCVSELYADFFKAEYFPRDLKRLIDCYGKKIAEE